MSTKPVDVCPRKKCGEFNMLKCVREAGHDGACNYVVDHENDYAIRKTERTACQPPLSNQHGKGETK